MGNERPREPTRNGDEYDVVSNNGRWRRIYCYTQRTGVTAKIKRQIRRRERRNLKKDIDFD